jgi:hypothetical protein
MFVDEQIHLAAGWIPERVGDGGHGRAERARRQRSWARGSAVHAGILPIAVGEMARTPRSCPHDRYE